jgi:hypothetical protein
VLNGEEIRSPEDDEAQREIARGHILRPGLAAEEGSVVYKGFRGEDDSAHVRRGVRPLELYLGVMSHSPDGFEWGYEGSGPAQLALALVCDALGIDPDTRARGQGLDHPPLVATALRVYQTFKRRIVARLPREQWRLTRTDVLRAIEAVEKEG